MTTPSFIRSSRGNMMFRKSFHIFSGVVMALSPLFVPYQVVIAMGMLGIIVALVARQIPQFRQFGPKGYTSYGDIFFGVGITSAAILFLPENIAAFQFGVLVLTLADAGAGLIGTIFGRTKVFGKKTVLGTSAFFLTTLILLFVFGEQRISGAHLIAVASLLAALELVLIYGLDNLVLPIAAGFLFEYVTNFL